MFRERGRSFVFSRVFKAMLSVPQRIAMSESRILTGEFVLLSRVCSVSPHKNVLQVDKNHLSGMPCWRHKSPFVKSLFSRMHWWCLFTPLTDGHLCALQDPMCYFCLLNVAAPVHCPTEPCAWREALLCSGEMDPHHLQGPCVFEVCRHA